MSRIAPCLWFDGNAEEAVDFYASLMPDSRLDRVMRAPTDYPGGKAGGVVAIDFTIGGDPFVALNGGPHYSFTPAVSFFVTCEDQSEVDRLWAALSNGGTPMQCGWITDRFGVTWQIVPKALGAMIADPDPARAARVFEAMMPMVKLDLAALERAHRGADAA